MNIKGDELIELIKEEFNDKGIPYNLNEPTESTLMKLHEDIIESKKVPTVYLNVHEDSGDPYEASFKLIRELHLAILSEVNQQIQLVQQHIDQINTTGDISGIVDEIASSVKGTKDEVPEEHLTMMISNLPKQELLRILESSIRKQQSNIQKLNDAYREMEEIKDKLKADISTTSVSNKEFLSLYDECMNNEGVLGMKDFVSLFRQMLLSLDTLTGMGLTKENLNANDPYTMSSIYISGLVERTDFKSSSVIKTSAGKYMNVRSEDDEFSKSFVNKINQMQEEKGIEATKDFIRDKMESGLAEDIFNLTLIMKDTEINVVYSRFDLEEPTEEGKIAQARVFKEIEVQNSNDEETAYIEMSEDTKGMSSGFSPFSEYLEE